MNEEMAFYANSPASVNPDLRDHRAGFNLPGPPFRWESRARLMQTKKSRNPQNDLVTVRRSGVHGRGVFARRDIPLGKRIIEYTGQRISWQEAQDLPPLDPDDPHHTFFYSLDDGRVINAAVGGNEARWINHSCAPNCRTDEVKSRIYIYALHRIQAGEELFYDYCLEPADKRTRALERLFACHCGNAECRGTMLEPRAEN